MLDKSQKREAARAYKERKTSPGIFAVRCTQTGDVWVGATRNLDTQQNSTFFTLRTASHTNKKLLAAFNQHGEDAFTYEAVEEIDAEDLTTYLLNAALKDREHHWRENLKAANIIG
ncbi:MAG TPA: GIY-YIG nuclease family protein [Rhizomicrobium sp.]|nr:GIY-YIG nuclease family protein [Rhizomicrobium sp.]